MIERLLEIKRKLKSRKPNFRRHDSHKKVRVSASWRSPKGHQSKQRLNRRGYARGIATGYGAPKEVYGLTRDGLTQNVISSVKELDAFDPKKDGIIISRTLGNRKRVDVVKAATEKKFVILNLDVEKFNKSMEAQLKEKESRQKVIAKKRDEKEKAAKKSDKKSDKQSVEKQNTADLTDEEKKLAEKKEHDKILTQKGDQQ
ncbi:hypothetical protein JXA48_01070 [Candidatus Woesearchaeota archaeon]|nr:hypothetical protein [Candidatus Woesearchaeota archaeon]